MMYVSLVILHGSGNCIRGVPWSTWCCCTEFRLLYTCNFNRDNSIANKSCKLINLESLHRQDKYM